MKHSDTTRIKSKMREQMKQKRSALPKKEYEEKSKILCHHIQTHDIFQSKHSILFFAPSFNEPNIFPLAEQYLSQKKIHFPRVSGNELEIKRVFEHKKLKEGFRSILEPEKYLPNTSPQKIDLVLVPALAIDTKGNRLGFGGGFYDRLLQHYSAIKMAVIFDFQYIPQLPHQHFDIPMNAVATESGIFSFNNKDKRTLPMPS
jgi:5-formyltetrahydrofolate cyclo-ligase